uniref:Phosphatidic acid phosphatase type 2/haloperoxidase domain-containing protein n=1 Tax=Mola mola TaxID=94237 RepID=A0A3Q4BEJ0_MOLML
METRGRLVELFHYLQDPHLVARFQRVCGVRGTFSRTASDGTHAHNNGDCRGHISGEKESEKPVGRRGRSENGPQNGAVNGREEGGPDAGPPGSSSTLKPLRKNSLTGDAGLEFVIENRFLYYLFTFGTELGNELFYITFFPFVMWNVDAFVARRLVLVWVWVMYLGQCTKDVLGWSRPTSPPVVKVEMLYNSEYSMPSTHAMSATAIPVSLFLLSFGRWQYPFSLGFSLALCWCLVVGVSRIYMGMHSVLDVMAGVLYSILILLVILPALDLIDGFNLTCRYAPLIIICLHLGLGLFSFTLDTWSTSRGDTAQILGTGAGVALASHVNHLLGLMPDPTPEQLPFTFFSADVRKARQHMEVELPYRYIVYGTVGFNVLFLVPLLFRFLQLS